MITYLSLFSFKGWLELFRKFSSNLKLAGSMEESQWFLGFLSFGNRPFFLSSFLYRQNFARAPPEGCDVYLTTNGVDPICDANPWSHGLVFTRNWPLCSTFRLVKSGPSKLLLSFCNIINSLLLNRPSPSFNPQNRSSPALMKPIEILALTSSK